LSDLFSYIDIDTDFDDPPITAQEKNNMHHIARVRLPRFPSASGSSDNDDDDGWKEKKKVTAHSHQERTLVRLFHHDDNGSFRHVCDSGSNGDGDGGKEKKKVKNNMHLITRDRLPATPSAIRRRGKKKKKCHSWTTTTATKKAKKLPATRFPSAIRRREKKKKKSHSWTTTTATKKAKKRTNGPLLSAQEEDGYMNNDVDPPVIDSFHHRGTSYGSSDSGDDGGWKEKKKVKNNMHPIATQGSLSSKAAATAGEWRRVKKKRVGHVLTMEQQRSSGPRPL
jgi:hypothetical protein